MTSRRPLHGATASTDKKNSRKKKTQEQMEHEDGSQDVSTWEEEEVLLTPQSIKQLSLSSPDLSPRSLANEHLPAIIPKKTVSPTGSKRSLQLGLPFLVIGLIVITLLAWQMGPYSKLPDVLEVNVVDLLQKFKQTFPEFVSKFPIQQKEFWQVIKAAVKPIMQKQEPFRPAVVVLIAPEESAKTLTCLSQRLANLIEEQFQDPPSLFIHVDSHSHRQETKALLKEHLDSVAHRGFENGSRTFLIENIQEMHGESALMLHGLCDDTNAPFKRVAYILTVLQPKEETIDIKNFEVTSLWKHDLEENKRFGLESRIGALKAVVAQESVATLEMLCPQFK